MMKKLLILPILALFLAGCDQGQIQPIVNKYHVILAPESMYNCPVVKKWPAVKTLTDLQTARLLVTLAENNNICKRSLDSIHQFYYNAKRKFEGIPSNGPG